MSQEAVAGAVRQSVLGVRHDVAAAGRGGRRRRGNGYAATGAAQRAPTGRAARGCQGLRAWTRCTPLSAADTRNGQDSFAYIKPSLFIFPNPRHNTRQVSIPWHLVPVASCPWGTVGRGRRRRKRRFGRRPRMRTNRADAALLRSRTSCPDARAAQPCAHLISLNYYWLLWYPRFLYKFFISFRSPAHYNQFHIFTQALT